MSGNLEQVVIVRPDGAADPEGHVAAMVAKVDGAVGADAPRPEWLPEKFATVEDMAKSYKELEAKQGVAAPAPAPAAAAPVAAPAAPADALAISAAADAAVAKAGLDMAALSAEYNTSGALSADSLAKLAATGINQQMVDNHIAGLKAMQQVFLADVKSVTPGGAEKYSEMIEWAKVNLTPTEIAAYDKATATSDPAAAKLAVAGLGARFSAAVGNEPNLQGGRASDAGADVFESIEQMRQAMRDPRYKADPAYRSKVVAKLGRSNIM